jgi:hypothetical protein
MKQKARSFHNICSFSFPVMCSAFLDEAPPDFLIPPPPIPPIALTDLSFVEECQKNVRISPKSCFESIDCGADTHISGASYKRSLVYY